MFEFSCVPLMSVVIEEGAVFNWAEIFPSNMMHEIKYCSEAPIDKPVGLFMLTYLLDVVCAVLPFQAMNFQWMVYFPPCKFICINYGIQYLGIFSMTSMIR